MNKPKEFTLQNGLEVLYIEDDDYPVTTMRMIIPAGEIYSDENYKGIAGFTNQLLREGTINHSQNALAVFLDQKGAVYQGYSDEEFSIVQLTCLEEFSSDMTDFLYELVTEADFPQKEIDIIKNQKLSKLQHLKTQPEYLLHKYLRKNVYQEHPYSFYQIETETLNRISRNDITNFYKTFYHPNNSRLLILSSLKFDKIKTIVENKFSKWKANSNISNISNVLNINDYKLNHDKEIFIIDRKKL